jgi:hypothetical protein
VGGAIAGPILAMALRRWRFVGYGALAGAESVIIAEAA